MSFTLTSAAAIELTERFIGMYALLDSCQKLFNNREFKQDGIFSWETLSESRFFSVRLRRASGLLALVFAFRPWMFLLLLRAAAGVCLLLLAPPASLAAACLLVLFVVGSLNNLQQRLTGVDTESRFSVVIAGGLLLRSIAPTEHVTIACLWFIALQACFSYFTAGLAKVFSHSWRSGNGLLYVVNTPGIIPAGSLSRFLNRRPLWGKFLTFVTIAIECFFPLILFLRPPLLWILISWGIIFHLMNAIWLRLGSFFWVWVATYPAIIFIALR